MGFLVAQRAKNLSATWETWVWSLGREDPLEKGMATYSVFSPGESCGQRSLVGYRPQGRKESDTTEPLTLSHQAASQCRELLPCNKVNPPCVYVWPLFVGFYSHLGHPRTLITEFPGLHRRSLLIVYFIHGIDSTYMSIPVYVNLNLPPISPPISWCPHICSLWRCLYFCFANRLICTGYVYFKYTLLYHPEGNYIPVFVLKMQTCPVQYKGKRVEV